MRKSNVPRTLILFCHGIGIAISATDTTFAAIFSAITSFTRRFCF